MTIKASDDIKEMKENGDEEKKDGLKLSNENEDKEVCRWVNLDEEFYAEVGKCENSHEMIKKRRGCKKFVKSQFFKIRKKPKNFVSCSSILIPGNKTLIL